MSATLSEFLTVSRPAHDQLVEAAYRSRGYTADEAAEGAKLAAEAARPAFRTVHAPSVRQVVQISAGGS